MTQGFFGGTRLADTHTPYISLSERFGLDRAKLPARLARILSIAEDYNYRFELLTNDGLVQISQHGRVVERIKLNKEDLSPTHWEEKVARIVSQIFLMRVVKKFPELTKLKGSKGKELSGYAAIAQSSTEFSGGVESAFSEIKNEKLALAISQSIGLASAKNLSREIYFFPGAIQLVLLQADRPVVNLVFNPRLDIVLEYRVNLSCAPTQDDRAFLPLLAGIEGSELETFRTEINRLAKPVRSGFLNIVEQQEKRLVSLVERSSSVGNFSAKLLQQHFGDLVSNGFTHFVVPLPTSRKEELALALKNNTLAEFFQSSAKRVLPRSRSRVSGHWCNLLQRAYENGLEIVPLGDALRVKSSDAVKTLSDILRANESNRILLWTNMMHVAGIDWNFISEVKRELKTINVHTLLSESPGDIGSPLRAAFCPGETTVRRSMMFRPAEYEYLTGRKTSSQHDLYYEDFDSVLFRSGAKVKLPQLN